MYLLRVNATANGSLLPTRNDVIWSARLRTPGYKKQNPAELAEIKSYYIIMRETLVRKRLYHHLTRMVTGDEIINTNASKAPWKAKN